jgi:hypothetical protein
LVAAASSSEELEQGLPRGLWVSTHSWRLDFCSANSRVFSPVDRAFQAECA